jgi:acetate---CoA ligase (ADP-forming)
MIAYGNLVQFGFGDRTYLVNRRGAVTHGRPAVRSCAEIGEPVDVAFLMVPQTGMLEAELAAHAQSLGMALLGPNHLGFANFTEGIPVPVPPAAGRRGQWSEDATRRMLAGAGIPVVPARLVTSADDAIKAAAEFGGTVCVKVVSPQIAHKSDIGGVRLDVPAVEESVRDAFRAVTAAAARADGATVDGVLVTPMRRGGIELLIGAVRDPQWGPMLAVALGGLFVEVLQDSALALAPVSAEQARRMLDELRGRAVLDGIGGAAPADLEGLAAVIARAGDLAVALGDDLDSLEINPLRVDGAAIEALDAVVTWAGKDNG